jgi:pimeloyl-ACP methyl ester carboxylesterase
VASSLGGKIAVEFAVRYPAQVERLVLLCPSGIGPEEQLPFVQGVRRSDLQALVQSVFHDPRRVDPRLLAYYARNFTRRPWRTGLVRTIRGTRTHCIRDRLPHVKHPTLFVIGNEDRIVDPALSEQAARLLPQGRLLSIPECGHAPHLERPGLVNRLVVRFLAGKVLEGSF